MCRLRRGGGVKRLCFCCCFTIPWFLWHSHYFCCTPSIWAAHPLFLGKKKPLDFWLHTIYLCYTRSVFGAHPLFVLHTLYLCCTPSFFFKLKKKVRYPSQSVQFYISASLILKWQNNLLPSYFFFSVKITTLLWPYSLKNQ